MTQNYCSVTIPQRIWRPFPRGKRRCLCTAAALRKRMVAIEDVKNAVESAGGTFYELVDASRELETIEKGIQLVKENGIELVIGAGEANIMDCAKLIAFGTYHADDLWAYVKAEKNPYGLKKLPLLLMPTYPSSGSEYGMGAVSADSRTGDFGTAYGITADTAILVPKYSMTLGTEMTAYTGLVTLVQLSASTIGDKNPVSYDIYELEFIPEVLYGASYRKSLTTLFPRFLKAMAKYHAADIRSYFRDAFGYEGSIEESADQMLRLFAQLGIDMYFDGKVSEDRIKKIEIATLLSPKEVTGIMKDCLR